MDKPVVTDLANSGISYTDEDLPIRIPLKMRSFYLLGNLAIASVGFALSFAYFIEQTALSLICLVSSMYVMGVAIYTRNDTWNFLLIDGDELHVNYLWHQVSIPWNAFVSLRFFSQYRGHAKMDMVEIIYRNGGSVSKIVFPYKHLPRYYEKKILSMMWAIKRYGPKHFKKFINPDKMIKDRRY